MFIRVSEAAPECVSWFQGRGRVHARVFPHGAVLFWGPVDFQGDSDKTFTNRIIVERRIERASAHLRRPMAMNSHRICSFACSALSLSQVGLVFQALGLASPFGKPRCFGSLRAHHVMSVSGPNRGKAFHAESS